MDSGGVLGTHCEWIECHLRPLGVTRSSGDTRDNGAGNDHPVASPLPGWMPSGYEYLRVVRIFAHGVPELRSGD